MLRNGAYIYLPKPKDSDGVEVDVNLDDGNDEKHDAAEEKTKLLYGVMVAGMLISIGKHRVSSPG